MSSVTLNGNTYTDDSDPTTGLAAGGHRTRLVPMLSDAMVEVGLAKVAQVQSAASAASAATSEAGAAASAGVAGSAAVAAGSASTQAQAAASAAQALALGVSTGRPSLRPSLLLAPASMRALDPRAVFARSTAAWRTDELGQVAAASVLAGVPRFQFSALTQACHGLLIEPAATNLLRYSQDFRTPAEGAAAAWWYVSNVGSHTLTPGVVGPDGGGQWSLITEAAGLSVVRSRLNNFGAVAAGVTLTARLHIAPPAASAGRDFRFVLSGNALGGVSHGIVVNMASGAVLSYLGTVTAATSSVQPLAGGGGWVVTITAVTTTADTAYVQLMTASGANTTYVADGRECFRIWQCDVVAAASVGTPLPTTSAQVARTADTCTLSTAGWLRAGVGTVYAEFTRPAYVGAGETPRVLTLHDGSASNRIAIALQRSAGVDQVGAFITAAGVDTHAGAYANYATGATVKVALAWDAAGAVLCVNGAQVWASASAALPAGLSTLSLGADSAGANQLGGAIGRLAAWQARLATVQLQALTAQ